MRRACLPLGFSLPARPRGTAADATLRWLDFTSPDEAQEFELATDAQFAPGTDTVEKRTYKVSFGQIYLSNSLELPAPGGEGMGGLAPGVRGPADAPTPPEAL